MSALFMSGSGSEFADKSEKLFSEITCSELILFSSVSGLEDGSNTS